MSEEIQRHVRSVKNEPAIMYGSSKVHNKYVDGCPPFRPILSALQTPNTSLQSF